MEEEAEEEPDLTTWLGSRVIYLSVMAMSFRQQLQEAGFRWVSRGLTADHHRHLVQLARLQEACGLPLLTRRAFQTAEGAALEIATEFVRLATVRLEQLDLLQQAAQQAGVWVQPAPPGQAAPPAAGPLGAGAAGVERRCGIACLYFALQRLRHRAQQELHEEQQIRQEVQVIYDQVEADRAARRVAGELLPGSSEDRPFILGLRW